MYDSKANGLKRLLGMNCLSGLNLGGFMLPGQLCDQSVHSRSWGKGRPSDFSVANMLLVAFGCAFCCGERLLDFGSLARLARLACVPFDSFYVLPAQHCELWFHHCGDDPSSDSQADGTEHMTYCIQLLSTTQMPMHFQTRKHVFSITIKNVLFWKWQTQRFFSSFCSVALFMKWNSPTKKKTHTFF